MYKYVLYKIQTMTESKTYDTENSKIMEGTDYNEEYCIIHKQKKEIFSEAEIECNLQTPLMFSRCSSLGSLSGFEQQSVYDDNSSIVSDFSPKGSRAVSPISNLNELSKSPRLLISQNNNSTQGIQHKILYNEHFSMKKIQLQEKIHVPEPVSFQYDTAFKKPHFLKHSVFEDDIAAFKVESSPNLLSTAASSLSSLTIDDDDYCDSLSPNKAGLVKRKSNLTTAMHIQKTSVQEHWRQDPIGGVCEPLQNFKLTETKRIYNNQCNTFPIHSVEKKIADEKFDKYIHTTSYEEQLWWEQQKRINLSGRNPNDIKKSSLNFIPNQYFKGEQSTRIEAEGCAKQSHLRTDQHLFGHHKTESNLCDKYNNKSNEYELCYKEKQKIFEQNRLAQGFYRYNKEINHRADESNDVNAYEEQLLDQCIRRGMAKVTKRNINDIKPFCWDFNQICLTTRALLKTHDEEILKDRKDERNKRRFLHKGLSRRIINSRNK